MAQSYDNSKLSWKEDKEKVKYFLEIACDQATKAVKSNKGGPFGAVVVKDGEIVVATHNRVLQTNDPTAHAEVTAIREACAKLGTFSLDGCILYSSSEPCPMCFTACLWARLEKVYYACTIEDAAESGFDDREFYEMITDEKKRYQYAIAGKADNSKEAMRVWVEKEDKIAF